MAQILVVNPISYTMELMREILSPHELVFTPLLNQKELLAKLPNFDVLIIRSQSKVDAELLSVASRLRLIGVMGVGLDNVDLVAAKAQKIKVINSKSGNKISAAEHTFALILSLLKNIPRANGTMHQGKFCKDDFLNCELFKKKLGIIGFGRIGSYVGKLASAFGMKILANDPYLSEYKKSHALGVTFLPLKVLLRQSDVLTLHVPKTKQTTNMLDSIMLQNVKKGAFLINAARGGIVCEEALRDLLLSNHLSGVAIDTHSFELSSKDPQSPLIGLQNVILTPHIGSGTKEAKIRVTKDVCIKISRELYKSTDQGS